MSVTARTRPPRKPTRTSVLSAARPVLFVLLAAVLAMLLLTAAIHFAARQTAAPADAPWRVEVVNRTEAAVDDVALLAIPASRGVHPIAEKTTGDISVDDEEWVSFWIHRACWVRVEVEQGDRIHVFEKVVPVGPGHDSRAAIEITPGPRVNGRISDEVRSP